jgi:hypothetical protein
MAEIGRPERSVKRPGFIVAWGGPRGKRSGPSILEDGPGSLRKYDPASKFYVGRRVRCERMMSAAASEGLTVAGGAGA